MYNSVHESLSEAEADSDGDGLPDVFEETYGTDPLKKDTDGDGLTDYEEIYLTGTDPLVYNSVDEALSDAEADSDEKFNGMRDLLYDTVYGTFNSKLSEVNLFLWVYRNNESIAEIRIDEVSAFSRISGIGKSAEGEEIDVTSVLSRLDQRFGKEENGEPILFLMLTDENNILAQSKNASEIYQTFSERENLFVSFVSDTLTNDCYIKKIVDATNGEILNFDSSKLKNYIFSFMPEEYMIITANNYERVKLDELLVKGSKTDTDLDGIKDWNEVNVDLIYQLNPSSMGKKALLMDDMPTYRQCKDALYEELFYVREGLTRFKQSEHVSGMPVSDYEKYFITLLDKIHITPIRSCPIDADGDNDGIVDKCDTNPLDKNDRSVIPDSDQALCFAVHEYADAEEYVVFQDNSIIKRLPFCNEQSINFLDNGKNARMLSLVYSDENYWIKILLSHKVAYLLYDSSCDLSEGKIREYLFMVLNLNDLYASYPSGTYFNNSKTEPCLHHVPELTTCYLDGSCGCTSYTANEYTSIQCMGFASMVFSQIHKERYLDGSDASSANKIKEITNSQEVREFISDLSVGSHVRLKLDSYAHSIIIYSFDYNYVEVYDANSDFKCGIMKSRMSYEEFFKKYSIIYTYKK